MDRIQLQAFSDELCKIAEGSEKDEKPPPSMVGTVAKGLAGLGIGTLAGYGLGRGIEAVANKYNVPAHKYVMPIAMGAGFVGPIVHQLWKQREAAALKKAHEYRQREKTKSAAYALKKKGAKK